MYQRASLDTLIPYLIHTNKFKYCIDDTESRGVTWANCYRYAPTSRAWVEAYGPHSTFLKRLYPAMAPTAAGTIHAALMRRATHRKTVA